MSSLKIKNIEGTGEAIEQEALQLFKQIPLYKYSYKDKLKHGEGSQFGVIAEHLQAVLPEYVNPDKDFVPNILQECEIVSLENNCYSLTFKQALNALQSEKLRLLTADNALELIITKVEDKRLWVNSISPLPAEGFAYGTYESCPSVAKNKLFELSMVVLKQLINRVERLEKPQNVTV